MSHCAQAGREGKSWNTPEKEVPEVPKNRTPPGAKPTLTHLRENRFMKATVSVPEQQTQITGRYLKMAKVPCIEGVSNVLVVV